MCGIVGKVHFNGSPVDQQLIRRMAGAIKHRGPDDEGSYFHDGVGFGFRRLSIIDLSPAGHQPMCNEDGTIWIIFNGEIYNFQELRPDLEKLGHRFSSHTDTETIIHLYEQYGERCVEYLRGMFSFAIWDQKSRKLLLARDRVGKKPLKYHLSSTGITFASELKSILLDPTVKKEMDSDAIHQYLSMQYVPHPATGFVGIKKLPPAHYLSIRLRDGSPPDVNLKKYWSLDYSKKIYLSESELHGQILRRLEEAVKIRMIADVPIGAFLSGGVDSSAVVAMMAKHSVKPIRTFSIGFDEMSHNELPKAKIISQLFSTEHTEFIVRPNAMDILSLLVHMYEEPYADSSAIPTYYLSQQTRREVTVALNGDGGDETFAGYPWYAYQKLASLFDRIPLRYALIVAQKTLELFGGSESSTFLRRAYIFFRTHRWQKPERYLSYFTSSYFTDWEKRSIYTDAFHAAIRQDDWQAPFRELYLAGTSPDPLDQAQFADINSYLPDDLLVKVDIASMANSLEARSPFLDHRLIEFAASIPANQRMPRYSTKELLKHSLRKVLPDEILFAPKQGFSVPLGAWFRGELNQFAKQMLLDPQSRILKLIKSESIRRLLGEHERGRVDHGSRIWSLLTLAIWLDMHSFSL